MTVTETQPRPAGQKFETLLDPSKSARDILRSKERRKRIEPEIPISHIITEDAIIDKFHARDLGNDIKEKGQTTPVTIRARIIDTPITIHGKEIPKGEVVYDIIDGYHRTDGEIDNNSENIQASVLYGCTDEELFDLRILSASSIETVQIPRMANWITKAYGLTPYPEKRISVATAFGYASNVGKTRLVEINTLTDEEKTGIKNWVASKCNLWQKKSNDIYEILRLVKDADPELVKELRSGKMKDIDTWLLKMVSFNFNGAPFYNTQRAILAAIEHRPEIKKLSRKRLKTFIEDLTSHITQETTVERIPEIVMNAELPPDEKAPSRQPAEKTIYIARIKELQRDNQTLYRTNRKLEERNQELLAENAALKENIPWWDRIPGLTNAERVVAHAFAEHERARLITNTNITHEQFNNLLSSAVTKKNIYNAEYRIRDTEAQ